MPKVDVAAVSRELYERMKRIEDYMRQFDQAHEDFLRRMASLTVSR